MVTHFLQEEYINSNRVTCRVESRNLFIKKKFSGWIFTKLGVGIHTYVKINSSHDEQTLPFQEMLLHLDII